MDSREIGNLGEKFAQKFLKKNGHKIIVTNYRSTYGEIDIISQQAGCLIFTEVRCKRNLAFGTPEESIVWRKKQKLVSLAQGYIQKNHPNCTSWRIDFIAVELDTNNKAIRIEHFDNAIGE
jgi:putative endonuclease